MNLKKSFQFSTLMTTTNHRKTSAILIFFSENTEIAELLRLQNPGRNNSHKDSE